MTEKIPIMDSPAGVGEAFQPGPESPLCLLGTSDIFRVTSGRAMVFAQRIKNGAAVGERVHVATFHAGDVLPGMGYGNSPAPLLLDVTTDPETAFCRYALPPSMEPAAAREIERSFLKMLPEIQPSDTADTATQNAVSLCGDKPAEEIISGAAAFVLHAILGKVDAAQKRFNAQVLKRQAMEETTDASVMEGLRHVIDPRTEDKGTLESGLPLLDACRMVAKGLGMVLPLHVATEKKSWISPLEQICRAGSFRSRSVVLEGEWWKRQNGPILAENGRRDPVALIPKGRRYDAYIFDGGGPARATRVDADFARTLSGNAWTFYRPLPGKSMGLRDVLRFAVHGSKTDISAIICLAVGVSLISLVVPYAIGKLIDHVIPNAGRNDLLIMVVVLATTAFAVSLLSLASGFAMLRFQTRASYDFLAALLERTISLPTAFFREFSAGDLCQRIMGIEKIRETLTQSTLSTLVTGVSALGYLILIFYYNRMLALVALGFTLLTMVVTGTLASIQVHFQYRIQTRLGRLDALMLQLFTGIDKIRVSAAERRMFTNWGLQFRRLWINEFKAGVTTNILTVFNGAYTIAGTMVLYWVYVHYMRNSDNMPAVSTGVFMAVFSAFSTLLLSAANAGSVIMPTLMIIPIYKRLKPVIETLPEGTGIQTEAGPLSGGLKVEGVTFGYDPNLPPVLENVSIHAEPGEFVAIVGPSGSGKSTLLKILLGIETAQKGEIFYDRQSLSHLDIHSIRRQIGVVMQDTQIMPGFIRELLIGSANLSLDDAWEAVRLAGIEEEIRAMPMGMFTYISDATVSGGQRQRLLIARALITRPRMLFFDEATSALDSLSQAVVRESIDHLGVTRIVIAHRLSTIMNADRIYVIDAGRIVQNGTYPELMKSEGLFKRLAARQLI